MSELPQSAQPQLHRGLTLRSATALNMIDMIGVGPFITIPLMVHAMGGPQAMLGWVLGAVFALLDGMVWSELGAAFPRAGGSYEYLKESFGARGFGRMASFLFVWQLSFSAPLSIASGCIGLAQYAAFIWSDLGRVIAHQDVAMLGITASLSITRASLVAIAVCVLAVFLLYRRITFVAQVGQFLWIGVIGTVAWVIFAGITHFAPSRAFEFPAGAFSPNSAFFAGLAGAMLIAAYDYWGYYNICFVAGEVKDPGRTLPRAVMYSILAVAAIYIVMNISVLGVVPWRELNQAAVADQRTYVIATMMQRIYGTVAGQVAAALIMWTAFASVFSLLLGYSRVPFAAAADGNYFRAFASIDAKRRIPNVSLLALGAVACIFCLFKLADVIAALVVIRIMLQFVMQTIGVMVLRKRRPELERPFRIWWYPLPPLLSLAGFVFVIWDRAKQIWLAIALTLLGSVIYLVRAWRRGEWPFADIETLVRAES